MQAPQPCYKRVCLETSLKPFKQLDDASISDTCRLLWRNWQRLTERGVETLVMLWVGDGSEILQWQGDYTAAVPWADHIGFCNYGTPGAFPPDNRHYRVNQAVPYMAETPKVTFDALQRVISALRATAREFGIKGIRVGATIDPGPEFVNNDWKFARHPEILTPDGPERMPCMMHFLTHQATIQPDDEAYAGFPDGLHEPVSFGTFLGRQLAAVIHDLGYDFIWLSNGFGYTHFPWTCCGEVFDGAAFDGDRATHEIEQLHRFWGDLRRQCPDVEIQVRGTNFTVGMDIAANGVSHVDINTVGKLQRPPTNPPWGSRALGLEMASYLSRIAKTPTDQLPFRYYVNDPWFVGNPWYGYYEREPFDIYVPMAASRLNDAGGVDAPTDVTLLTVDTEHGELLPDEAGEVIPHLLRAAQTKADAAGPLVWVYPFDEYDDLLKRRRDRLPAIFAHEWFATAMINAGLPVNTVCSTDRFAELQAAGRLPRAVFVAPAPGEGSSYGEALLAHVRAGGAALLYGPLDDSPAELLAALGVTLDAPLEGDFDVQVNLAEDRFERPPERPVGEDSMSASIGLLGGEEADAPAEGRVLRHRALVSGGGLRAVATADDCDVKVAAAQGAQTRAYAVERAAPEWNGGRLAWIRGTSCFDLHGKPLEPRVDQVWQFIRPDDWPRRMLASLGIDILQDRRDETVRAANVFIKRFDGAWWFVGHKPDTSARFRVRTADGAPCYHGIETPIAAGYGGESFGKTFHSPVRTFVKMSEGIVKHKSMGERIGRREHFSLSGLVGADVTIYPPPDVVDSGAFDLQRVIAGDEPLECEVDAERKALILRDYTGTLYVQW